MGKINDSRSKLVDAEFVGLGSVMSEIPGETDELLDIAVLRIGRDRYLQFYVTKAEAKAFESYLTGTADACSNTYEFIADILEGIEADNCCLVVSEVIEEVYYGYFIFSSTNRHGQAINLSINCDIIDAINVALRLKAPIFATLEIFEEYGLREDQIFFELYPDEPPAGLSLREIRGGPENCN